MHTIRQLVLGLTSVVALVATVAGCSSGLTREECELVDWRGIGYEDGLQGRPQTQVAQHRKDCAQHGVSMDLAAYREGWNAGVAQYCQAANGYRQGRNGAGYAAVCPSELEPAFLDAYREGRELYDLQSEVRRLSQAISTREQRLSQLESSIVDTSVGLVRPGLTTEQRVLMVDDLRRMQQEHATIKQELPALHEELARSRAELAIVSADRRY